VISIPLEFLPSSLVVTSEIGTGHSVQLLARSRQALAGRHWTDAERCALNARDACERIGGRMEGYAIALIHLADIYRAVGRLGPALEFSDEAQRLLDNLPHPKHYHNRAIANYALALTHHILGNDCKALHRYQQAQKLFDQAYRYWGRTCPPNHLEEAQGRQAACDRVGQWLSILSDSIQDQLSLLSDGQSFHLVWFPVFRAETSIRDGEYELVRFFTTIREAEDQVYVGDQPYLLLSPSINKSSSLPILDFRVLHYAVEVGEDDPADDLKKGDLALVRDDSLAVAHIGQADQIGHCEWGDFIRNADGSIVFVAKKEMHIIGEEKEEKEKEEERRLVIAVLRPK
jgi:tetratricopeptide (TPR) repeat protein